MPERVFTDLVLVLFMSDVAAAGASLSLFDTLANGVVGIVVDSARVTIEGARIVVDGAVKATVGEVMGVVERWPRSRAWWNPGR